MWLCVRRIKERQIKNDDDDDEAKVAMHKKAITFGDPVPLAWWLCGNVGGT